MGGNQTYEINLKDLVTSCLGEGKHYDSHKIYFFDKEIGLYCLPKFDFDKVSRDNEDDDTKTFQIKPKVI